MMKKLLLLLLALLGLGVSGAWATTTTETVKVNIYYGKFYNSMTTEKASNSPGWGNNYVSTNSLVPLTLCSVGSTTSAGNVFKHVASSSNVVLHNNLSGYPYTLSVPEGYTITGYTITGTSTGATPTAAGSGKSNTFGSSSSSLEVTGLSTQSTTFTVTGCGDASSDANCLTCQISVTVTRDAEFIIKNKTNKNNKIASTGTNNFTSSNSNIIVWKILPTNEENTDGYPTYTFQNAANSKYATCTPTYSSNNTVRLSWSETATGHYTFIVTKNGDYVNIRPSDADSDNKTKTYWTSWSSDGSGNIVFWTLLAAQSNWILETIPAPAASLQTNKCYNIMNLRGWWAVGNSATDINSTFELNLSWDASDTKQQFAFVKYNSKNYLYSVSEKKFAYLNGNKLSLTSYFTDEVAASNVTLAASTNANNSFYPAIITIQSAHLGVSTGKDPDVYKYTDATDEGNASLIVEAGDFDATDAQAQITNTKKITYKLTFNGTVLDSYNTDVYEFVGATASAPFDLELPAYCSLGSCTPAIIGAETTDVTVPLVWNGPFDISSDYENAIWYYITVGGKWAKYVASGDYPLFDELQTGDAGLWAFVGDPINGVECYNKSAGSSVKLNMDSGLPMSESGWTECVITRIDANSLYLTNGGYGPRSNGSKMVLGDGDESTHISPITFRSYYCQKALDDLEDYASDNAVGQYFGVRQESIDAIQGLFEGMPNMTSAQYTTYSVPTGVSAYLNIKKPVTGYYRIKNNETGNYIAYGQPSADYNEKDPGLIAISSEDAEFDASSVIKLTGSAGTYKLSTQGLNVQSQTTGSQAFPATDETGVDFVFNIATPGIVSITNAASAVPETDMDGSLHEATDGWTVHGVVNWSASDAKSKWVVEDATTVTITLNHVTSAGGSYATIYFPFDVTLETPGPTSGAVPYVVTIDGSRAQLEAFGSLDIPAGTPVLLAGALATESVTATITSGLSEFTGDNDLAGTYVGKSSLESNEYIFGTRSGELGFWKLKEGKKLGANKAYLVYNGDPGEVKGFAIDFGELVDGIGLTPDPSLSKRGEQEIYNLAGQRMSKPMKGVNIVNGRKVLVK